MSPTTSRPSRRMARLVAGVLAVACAVAAREAVAQSKTGTTIGQFLLIEPSARYSALGNTGVAAEPDLDGVYYNPALAAGLDRVAFAFSHVDWFAGIRYDYVAGLVPFGKWGNGFATVTSLNSGDMDVRTVSQPLGTGEKFMVSNIALGIGYSYQVTDRFSGGIQARWLQETIWHSSASTMTFDVGAMYQLSDDGLHLGSSITNFGTSSQYSGRDLDITYDQDPTRVGDNGTLPGGKSTGNYPVPVKFRVGVGHPYRLSPELKGWASVSAEHPSDNSESVSGGVELRYREMLSMRLGYQDLWKQDSEEGLAAGVGLRGKLSNTAYRIDYAYADFGRLEGVHRITVGWAF